MLRVLGHPVARCCDKLGAVGSNLEMVKIFMQHLWMLHDVVVVWPGAHFSKLPVITGPVKLFCLQLRTGVSEVLKVVK